MFGGQGRVSKQTGETIMLDLIIKLRNTIISTDDNFIEQMAWHCIESIAVQSSTICKREYNEYTEGYILNITNKVYSAVTSERVNANYGVLTPYEVHHLASEHNIDDMAYRVKVHYLYRISILDYEYNRIRGVLKEIYNADMDTSVRIGKLNAVLSKLKRLRSDVSDIKSITAFLNDVGQDFKYDRIDEVEKFASAESIADIDYEGVLK